MLKKLSRNLLTPAFLAALILVAAPLSKITAQEEPKVIGTINFDPKVDGFGFANYGNENRAWQNDLTAEDMIRFFGAKTVCITGDSAQNCVMKAAASEWLKKQLAGMNGGHCEGMASTILRLKNSKPFKTVDGKVPSFQSGANRAFDLKLDALIGNYIAYYFITQTFDEVATPTTETGKKGPVSVVTTLADAMKNGGESYTLGFYKYDRATGKKSDGHAITPIAVEDAGSVYRIHVYDNNYVGETRYVVVEKGGKQTWKYVTSTNPSEPAAEYAGDIDTKTLELTPNSTREKTCYEAPFAGVNDEKQCASSPAAPGTTVAAEAKGSLGGGAERAQFFLNNEGNLLVTTADGKRLGFDPKTNRFYEEISGGRADLIIGGRGKDIPNYTIPAQTAGKPYTITFSGKDLKEESTTDFTYSAPGLTVGFDRIRLDPNETLTTTISPDGETITFTSSADAETPGIYFAFDPQDGSGDSFLVRIGGAQIEAGKTLTAQFNFETHKVSFKDNDGDADEYSVEVERIKKDGTRRTLKKEFKEEGGKEIETSLDEWID